MAPSAVGLFRTSWLALPRPPPPQPRLLPELDGGFSPDQPPGRRWVIDALELAGGLSVRANALAFTCGPAKRGCQVHASLDR
jgi:hypothetical protein